MKRSEVERMKEMYLEYNNTCFVCGRQATQRAHIIGDTKANRKRYGNDIIDNKLNWLPACSLECNGLIDTSRNIIACKKIEQTIKENNYHSIKKHRIENIVRDNIERKRRKSR